MPLPQPEFTLHHNVGTGDRLADLTLPWEYRSRDGLFLNEYRRFQRSRKEQAQIRELLVDLLQSPLTKRTERRYRHPGASEPHVSTLIQLTLLHFARYSDSLRTGGLPIPEQGRYSLNALINAQSLVELSSRIDAIRSPRPEAVGNARREFIDWLPLLSFKFPRLNLREGSILRLSRTQAFSGLQPAIPAGSWMLLKSLDGPPNMAIERETRGWSRPLYVLRRGLHFLTGYLDQDGAGYALLLNRDGVPSKERFGTDELSSLQGVMGVAVPV